MEWMHAGICELGQFCEIIASQGNFEEGFLNLVVSIMSADSLTPIGAGPSAGILATKFVCRIYRGTWRYKNS